MNDVCSAPDIKVLGGEVFSFDTFGTFGKAKKACIDTPLFCDNPSLVAYALYDDVPRNNPINPMIMDSGSMGSVFYALSVRGTNKPILPIFQNLAHAGANNTLTNPPPV
jgi:hypothetical protein